MAETKYDVVIIGAGPGGYVAAIRAAQLGMKVACVDERDAPGGTCLNIGCIPSKALLHWSERYAEAKHEFAEAGIEIGTAGIDVSRLMERKEKAVHNLTGGVEFLFKKNKVEWVRGTGRIPEPGRVEVRRNGAEDTTLETKRIIVATGSEPVPLDGVEVDEERIVTSTGALSLSEVPERLVVIGAGVIGLELGSVWSRLGSQVTVIEYLDHVLPGMDGEISKQALRVFKKQGLEFHLSSRVTGARKKKDAVTLTFEPRDGDDAQQLEADVVLVSIGRRPHLTGLGLEEFGVELGEGGAIRVDERFETSVSGIHAIGDCIPGPMLAHRAEEDGIICVEMIDGQSGHVDYDRVPAVVYTWPEIASVGKTEERLKEEGVEYRVGKFPFKANSRARTIDDTEGLVKVLADARTDRILGMHIIGPIAGDLIMEGVIAMEFGATAEDIGRTVHHHPGMGEAVKEAALAVHERPIHI
ncbi:MAG: dihydrolipoyl dehydrogenase [Gemmatimonadetes bacterium]|uniref:Dihydrolipoyl dehydrogenase n=1 Tax=Candidatus Kutchimonas denitrificans TaxID=3056748 RepID=A0AAE4Z7U6_9BACT|nr:dihydrolipoyl dehydrogenase [Gemmatimonadota bacterium]NIR74593.1 dihydrolipoyl dehydrogenase [Candidatus Kutchimonas denitrificans]NIS02783.1 dihydrolipoyl dehydrogenase [Gemmatimonadota bacterium]NIT68944.1 dihydrolipoyl dehydrogenase [Gemmatimonadota bacterium]NIU52249.1 dihydrolipoyl dehydrogenase [Gemmatimonadota bacterium]